MRCVKKVWIYILLLFCVFELKAQQLPLYSNYMFSTFGHNPAYAGHKRRIDAILKHRNHMAGFPGAPTTQLLTASMPIQKYFIGTGLKIVHDRIGITRSTNFSGAGNYTLTLADGKLSAGLELGMQQYGIDWDKLDLNDPDNALPNTNTNLVVGNAAFGLFYDRENWYVGYSVQNLFRSKLNFDKVKSAEESRLRFHNYYQAGMAFAINDNFSVEPHTLIKYVHNAPMQVDLGGFIVYKLMAGAGMAFRTGDALYFTLKYEWNEMLSVGYNYGIRVNSLSPYTGSSHEFMISYFYQLLPPPIIKKRKPIWIIN